ncbi:MAG: LysM peptidoglycan-binding domain-containing protein [Bacteroidetes bacterium]|nr:LysM peptidoglycan-binding domain-containing protein [Bacteroidota bacterium]
MQKNMKIYGLILACLVSLVAAAQEKLEVKGKAPNLYVLYVLGGSETLQTVSSQFGFSVKKLSDYNRININASSVLPKGTKIKIPLTHDNLLQRQSENSAPVVHVIGKGENIYRISKVYYNVPMSSLRQWNHLTKDVVKLGQQLIIGYMVNAKPQTVSETSTVVVKEISPAISQPVQQAEETGKKNPGKKNIRTTSPVVKKDTLSARVPLLVQEKKAESKGPAEQTVKEEAVTHSDYVPRDDDEGYFAAAYTEHEKAQIQQFRSGDASTFKTISGWTDRKFYVLMNDVAPKTLVRITGQGNKSICAMVLGPLQETRGAAGLLVRISNSAAAALGLVDQKFTLTVTYFE